MSDDVDGSVSGTISSGTISSGMSGSVNGSGKEGVKNALVLMHSPGL